VGEALPSDYRGVRLRRTGILSRLLADRGHTVVWWTSSFDHFQKRLRFSSDSTLKIDSRLTIRCLHGGGYKKNVSLARLYDHFLLGRKLHAQAPHEERPDIVLASLPTIELAYAACRFGRNAGVPVALDIRDLWPDSFLDVLPRMARSAAHLLLSPYAALTRSACRQVTAILGPTEDYVRWGLKCGGRQKSQLDKVFPFGYSANPPADREIEDAKAFWESRGISAGRDEFIVCFLGTLGRAFDLETVFEAAGILAGRNPRIKFVICGKGDREAFYRAAAVQYPNVIVPGLVNGPQMWTLMRMASIGLAPYMPFENFLRNIPNKPIEYLSAGLPTAYCIDGALDTLLSEGDCGVKYKHGAAHDLASQLSALEGTPERLHSLSGNAAALFRARFQAEEVYGRLIDHLELIARTPIGATASAAPEAVELTRRDAR
jgi:glycosyltransferase involved in cell wall biosynthesis